MNTNLRKLIKKKTRFHKQAKRQTIGINLRHSKRPADKPSGQPNGAVLIKHPKRTTNQQNQAFFALH